MKVPHILFLFLLIVAAIYLYETQNIVGLVIVTGFLDGIHPCGFTVLLFFIAFLLSLKKSRGHILALGGLYILGVFIAYFSIGLGIMKAVSIFEPHFMAKAGAVLLIAVGGIALKDGLTGTSTLKIPKFSQPYIAAFLEKGTFLAALIAGLVAYEFLEVLGLYLNLNTFWGIFTQGFWAGIAGLLTWWLILELMGNEEIKEVRTALHRKFWKAGVVLPDKEEI